MKTRDIKKIKEEYKDIFNNPAINSLSEILLELPISTKEIQTEIKEPNELYVNNAKGFQEYIEKALNYQNS